MVVDIISSFRNFNKNNPNGYYAEELLYSPLYFSFYRIPKCVGLLESVFKAIVNRSRACPPSFLSAVFVADWMAGLNSLVRG